MKNTHLERFMALATIVMVLSLGSAVAATAASGETETLVLDVEGMWGKGCELFIAKFLLGDLDGIESIEADHRDDRVTVVFDSAAVSADRIAEEIDDCPFFDVTGSDSHEIDREILERGRSHRCW